MYTEPFSASSLNPELTVEQAAWRALLLWATLLVVTLISLAVTMIAGWPQMGGIEPTILDGWFAGSVVFYALVVPCAALWNRSIFQKHWSNGVVTPYGYLFGSAVLWGAFALCTIFACTACVNGGSFWPHAMLGMLGILLLLASWPSGRNMVNRRPRDEEDDDDIFHMSSEEEN